VLPDVSPEQQRSILRDRARRLAQPLEHAPDPSDTIEIIEFALARERYGIATSFVREVYPLRDLTPVPCTPAFVAGIINVRGELVPVIDLKKFFDVPAQGLTELHRIIVVQDGSLRSGILCDRVSHVRRISPAHLQKGLPTLTGIRQQYLLGIAADLTVILDAAAILRDPKIIVHEDVETAVANTPNSTRGES